MCAQNLSLSFGTQTIYDYAQFNIGPHDHVGIVGVNGAGKSTLFNIITGNIKPDSGYIDTGGARIGYLRQTIDIKAQEISVFDFLLSSRPITELNNNLEQFYIALAENPDDEKIAFTRMLYSMPDIMLFSK